MAKADAGDERWSPRRIVRVTVLVQTLYMGAVTAAPLFTPLAWGWVAVATRVPGREAGLPLQYQLLAAGGVVAGVVAGVLLSRLPVGYLWRHEGLTVADAGSAGGRAAAITVAAYGVFMYVAAVGVAYANTGQLFLQVALVELATRWLVYAVFNVGGGIVVGMGVFSAANVLSALVGPRRGRPAGDEQ
ncbi:MAG: hypothetical protein ABEH77_03555 [Halobacteriaceae archaeon]